VVDFIDGVVSIQNLEYPGVGPASRELFETLDNPPDGSTRVIIVEHTFEISDINIASMNAIAQKYKLDPSFLETHFAWSRSGLWKPWSPMSSQPDEIPSLLPSEASFLQIKSRDNRHLTAALREDSKQRVGRSYLSS
jgi:hypothetical protein